MVYEIHTESSSMWTLEIMPRNLNEIVLSWIRLLYAVQGQDTSLRDDLFYGFKRQGIDDPSNIIQGYLIQGHFIIASSQGCSHTQKIIFGHVIFLGGLTMHLSHFLLYFSISCHWGARITPITMLVFCTMHMFFILYSTTQYMNVYSAVSLLDRYYQTAPTSNVIEK